MTRPPWLFVEEALVAAQELRKLLGNDATTALLDVEPRPEHADFIAATLQTLNVVGELHERVRRAEDILRAACLPSGIIDPQDDRGDVPWCLVLRRLRDEPRLGSAVARGWARHLLRLRHDDHPVSVTMEGVAAYAVASFEMLSGRAAHYQRWMLIAANATDHEVDRPGLSLVVAVRAALLLDGQSGRPVPTRWRFR